MKWWRMMSNPTKTNDYFMLELSGTWKPPDNSRARDLIRAQDPAIVFLAETRLIEARLSGIKERLQMEEYFRVSKVTIGGGLALFWKKEFVVDIESSSLNHIDVLINKGKEDEWQFTGFYGMRELKEGWSCGI